MHVYLIEIKISGKPLCKTEKNIILIKCNSLHMWEKSSV